MAMFLRTVLGGFLAVSALGAASAQDADPALVDKGRYLATAGDCAACHMDPATQNPFAGGYAVESPLGKIFGSNITPSKADGIGSWSLEDFSNAVRKGRAPGGHYLYPAMPYTAFAGISDADIKALYSYFMLGVAPVDHKAPETDLGFPFNIRPVMLGWDMIYGGTAGPAVAPEGEIARGKYLADTLAHCSTCHTPRGALMAEDMSQYLAGGKVGSWTAPNITSDPVSGIGNWTQAELETYLKTGALHGKAIAAGEMGTAVQNSFSKLSDADRQAIAAYIKSVPAVKSAASEARSGWDKSAPLPTSKIETPLEHTDFKTGMDYADMTGAELYQGACATCHGYDGRGTPDHRLPALVGSSAVGSADPSNLVMTITQGVSRIVADRHVFMPAFGPQDTAFGTQFGPEQVAKVADYVATSFGDPAHHVTLADVEKVYASASGKSWLIANAAVLAWIGIAGAVIVLLGLLIWLTRRKASRKA